MFSKYAAEIFGHFRRINDIDITGVKYKSWIAN
jgi:hypothetical protein